MTSWDLESSGDDSARTVVMSGIDASGVTRAALQVEVTSSPSAVVFTASGKERHVVRITRAPGGDDTEEGEAAFRGSAEALRIVERAAADMQAADASGGQLATSSLRPLTTLVGGDVILTGFESFDHCVGFFHGSLQGPEAAGIDLKQIHDLCNHIMGT